MKINKYENFLLESVINELILEANVTLNRDFIEVLGDMETGFNDPVNKICEILLKIVKSGRDLDINQNNIVLSNEVDKVTFIPEDKLENATIKLLPGTVVNGSGGELHPIQKEAKLPLEGMVFTQPENFLQNDIMNNWKLVKTINMAIVPDSNYNYYILYYLQNTDDTTKFVTTYSHRDDVTKPFKYVLPENNIGKIKIGRYINRLLDLYLGDDPIERRRYTDSDVEKFVNKFISLMEYKQNALDHFRIIKGGEIKHWYLSNNYSGQTGQLGQSCMRYSMCQEFFDIYIDNPDVCQLLIFTDENDKLLGRALLWKLEDGSNYMDRIYTTRDSNIDLFTKWGKENGYTNHYERVSNKILSVKIEPKDYTQYPFMDTFKYYKPELGILSNKELEKPYLELQESNGQALRRIEGESSRSPEDM